MKKRDILKSGVWVLLVILVLSLAGCTGSESRDPIETGGSGSTKNVSNSGRTKDKPGQDDATTEDTQGKDDATTEDTSSPDDINKKRDGDDIAGWMNDGSDSAVSCAFAEDVGATDTYASKCWLSASEYAREVAVGAKDDIMDLVFYSGMMTGYSEGTGVEFEATNKMGIGPLSREQCAVVVIDFPGDGINNVFSYRDKNGVFHCVALTMSGKDGALESEEIYAIKDGDYVLRTGDVSFAGIPMDSFQTVLDRHREAQEGKYTREQVDAAGLVTGLVQQGWPHSTSGDQVRYLYFDVDNDGTDELIITYLDEVQDIYAYSGEVVRLAFSAPYRGHATLYPDGMLRLLYSDSVSDSTEQWLQYDPVLQHYFRVFEHSDTDGEDSYHTFSYYNIEESVYQYLLELSEGSEPAVYPVWIYEWAGELTKEAYESILPKTSPVTLPQGELLSGGTSSGNTDGGETADTIVLTDKMQKDLNLFLSNFAELGITYYDYGRSDVTTLIGFAYGFSWINKKSNLEQDGAIYRIHLDTVMDVVNRYFDSALRKDELYGTGGPIPKYDFYQEDEYIYFPPLGMSFNTIAVVERAENGGPDQLVLHFTTYELDTEIYEDYKGVIPERYYEYTKRDADQAQYLTKKRDGMAVVKKAGNGYRLQYYQMY